MAKKAAGKKKKSFEESLWDTATKLRGSVSSADYKHVVLGLIFLKFVSDKFEHRRQELIGEGKEKYMDKVEAYAMKNVFYLPEVSRWSYIKENAKQNDLAIKIDTALATVEKNNKSLQGALPDNYFSRLNLDVSKLAALIDTISNIDITSDHEEDIIGRVYEYFLGKFAANEGQRGGEFYTPSCIVNLIAEMIEPYRGKIYDPCCGSGGMFVQSLKFIESHQGNRKDISVYGQELTSTTYKLAKMNLAIRGISGNLGDVAADTFFKDQHKDLKADFIMANPPFNLKQWRADNELVDDDRWRGYPVPPTGNANYAWILHMLSKLSENGVAGFVLANGAMSTSTKGEGEIRQKLIENDHIDCMIALPGQLFYTTPIPVCIWFMTKNKSGGTPSSPGPFSQGKKGNKLRDRRGETLFIDARNMGTMVDRTLKELTKDDIRKITETFHNWRNLTHPHPQPLSQGEKGEQTSLSQRENREQTSLSQREKGEQTSLSQRENREQTSLSQREKGEQTSLSQGEKGEQTSLSQGEKREQTSLSQGEEREQTSLSQGEEREQTSLSQGEKGEQTSLSQGEKGEQTSLSQGEKREQAPRPLGEDSGEGTGTYSDVPGFCKSASLEEIEKHNFVLTPGRYVGAAEIEDDGIPFETKMTELSKTLYAQMNESNKLDEVIKKNLEQLGFGE